jgi:hypothetical protein
VAEAEEAVSDAVVHFVSAMLLAATLYKVATREPLETGEKAMFLLQCTVVGFIVVGWVVVMLLRN